MESGVFIVAHDDAFSSPGLGQKVDVFSSHNRLLDSEREDAAATDRHAREFIHTRLVGENLILDVKLRHFLEV